MSWQFICRRCDKEHSFKDYQISRFCVDCGSLLEKVWIERKSELKNSISVLENEKLEIARYIVESYAEDRRAFGDLEEKLLADIDVETVDGRFEVIILAILFSEWAMKEERAYHLWKKVTSWFKSRNLSYSDVLLGEDQKKLMEFKDFLQGIKAPSRFLNKITKTARNLARYDGNLDGLLYDSNWSRTITMIQNNCVGVSHKACWITRVMKQLCAWDVPGEYCCVSDSHIKGFLKKTGFLPSSDNLFNNSKVMWIYFNEPFNEKFYDLSIFRFARDHGCKNCEEKICNLSQIKKCHASCVRSKKNLNC